ncbi:ABC transporter ATP-binding protein [Halomarina oriensis]|uniref:ATP-binding cassette domain-containing protein n=1 Tax=Halomarina oriensis TaxID=671145 RepID=A0A6B0GHG6_9EURY|nr:ABC transporter ATP-binding protein [Halomarina oriensis]MWG34312.1 ATP-binding cassette domain-containing protein [Halomarina oriensis]
MPAIDVDGVTKRFGGGVTALQDLNLTVKEGEIYGFLGPNGAGKSTTINILLDFIRPTEGSATVLGMDAQADSKAVRRRVGVLPDAYHVYERLTGRQHVQFAIDSKETGERPEDLLNRVGISEAADRKAGGYSKGMAQRLVLAMALVGDPDLLILDEPSTGLDPNGAREMRRIIQQENDRGTTVFFSSHILEQVEAICDRVGILHNGELVAEDSMENLRANIGSGSTLTVTVDEPTEPAVEAVRDVPGVSEVSVDGTSIVVVISDASKTRILEAIEENGCEVRDFATEKASLEELFATYTEGGRDGLRNGTTPTATQDTTETEARR